MEPVAEPRLPDRRVRAVLLSGEYPVFAEKLNALGIETLLTGREERLPAPVAYHPDMQFCPVSPTAQFVLRGNPLRHELERYGISAKETVLEPASGYPGDTICNALAFGGKLLAGMDTADPAIRLAADKMGYRLLSVRQGYTACSVCLVSRNAAITADRGIGNVLRAQGIEVLTIRPGGIRLPGYDSGFIGGCCGLIDCQQMVFTGALGSHPDGEQMKEFLSRHGVSVMELSGEMLLDVGGIIPLALE